MIGWDKISQYSDPVPRSLGKEEGNDDDNYNYLHRQNNLLNLSKQQVLNKKENCVNSKQFDFFFQKYKQ